MSLRLLLLYIFCCVPFLASAQHWNVSAQGGGIFNSRSSRPTRFEDAPPIGGMGAAGLSYSWNDHWEGGLRIGYRRYAFMQEDNLISEDEFDPVTGTVTRRNNRHLKYLERIPAFVIAPFVNRHFGHGRMDYYIGISLAYLRFIDKEPDIFVGYVKKRLTDKNGFGIDADAGFAYRVTTAFAVYAEGTGGIVNIPSFTERANIYTASIALGIRVSFK